MQYGEDRTPRRFGMLWDMTRVTLIFLSHFLTLPMMSEPRPDVRHPGAVRIAVFIFLEVFSYVVLSMAGGLSIASGGIILIVAFLAYGLSFIYVSDGPVQKGIFIFVTYCIYYMFAAELAHCLSISGLIPSISSEGVMTLTLTGMSILYMLILSLGAGAAMNESLNGIRRGWGILVAFAVISFFSYSSMIMLLLFVFTYDFVLSFSVFAIMSILAVSAFAIVLQTISLLNERNDAASQHAQQTLLENELEAEREFLESARQFRHDMRHHNRLILEYLNTGNVEEARQYLNEYSAEITGHTRREWCRNRIANAYFRIVARRCSSSGAALSIRADIPEVLPLSSTELGSLLDGLIEHAFASSAASDDPFIAINARTNGRLLFFEIRNRIAEVHQHDAEVPEGSCAGFESLHAILSRYDGMLQCRHIGDMFIARFTLPLGWSDSSHENHDSP